MLIPLFFSWMMALAAFTSPLVNEADAVNKDRLLQLVNQVRKKGCQCGNKWYGPVPALSWNAQLEKAASAHSLDMSKNKFLSHTSSSGANAGERIKKAGYAWKSYGENIAAGYPNEKSVIEGGLKSPGHCSNLMSRLYREMGVGRAGLYWTQDFGSR